MRRTEFLNCGFLGRVSIGEAVLAEKIGHDPRSGGDGYRLGALGPTEQLVRICNEGGQPDEQCKAEKHRGEQTGSDESEAAGKQRDSGERKRKRGDDSPKHLSWRNPSRNQACREGKIEELSEGVRNHAKAKEEITGASGSRRPGGIGALGSGKDDERRGDLGKYFEKIAPVKVDERVGHDGRYAKQEKDEGDGNEQDSAKARCSRPLNRQSAQKFRGSGDVDEDSAVGNISQALPNIEFTPQQGENGDQNRGQSENVTTEVDSRRFTLCRVRHRFIGPRRCGWRL